MKKRLPTPRELATERMGEVQHISAITNNPRLGFMESIYSLFTETFSDLSYTPDMTEESVMPSPLIPQLDSDSFTIYYRALTKVFRPARKL